MRKIEVLGVPVSGMSRAASVRLADTTHWASGVPISRSNRGLLATNQSRVWWSASSVRNSAMPAPKP